MTPEELATAIRTALTEGLTEAAGAGDHVTGVPAEVRVERLRGGGPGVWSSNVALQLAIRAGMPPRDLAVELAGRLGRVKGILAVDVSGPGFLDFTCDAASSEELTTLLAGTVDTDSLAVARLALARSSAGSAFDVEPGLLARRRPENPIFSVQHAHARTCRIARLAAKDGVDPGDGFDPVLLTHESETVLLAALADFPRVVARAAELREPHKVARYLEDLARCLHRWHDTCQVLPRGRDDVVTDLERTRLRLNGAVRQVLASGLGLLGVSAPERI